MWSAKFLKMFKNNTRRGDSDVLACFVKFIDMFDNKIHQSICEIRWHVYDEYL